MSIHIGIIPDGNRRWCKKNNKTQLDYASMIQNMIKLLFEGVMNDISDSKLFSKDIDYPSFRNVSEISIYVLSKDNILKRDLSTIQLVEKTIDLVYTLLSTSKIREKIKLKIHGDQSLLPEGIQKQIKECVDISTGEYPINLAIGYDPVEDTKLYLESGIDSRNQIDLVIRSGGQLRSSGFFPLQILYSEWVYFDDLWPDITKEHIHEAILEFYKRQRNFGK